MLVDGLLAGETYGATPANLDEKTPDVPQNDPLCIYCYSSTVLPQFQGRGLSKLLVAYWNGLARGSGFTKVVGHATDPRIVAVRSFFGVRFGAVHPNWYGTTRTARYYEGDL
jgi:GNAT superfamily N-acetyltransferase